MMDLFRMKHCFVLVLLSLQATVAELRRPLIGIYPTGPSLYLLAYQKWLEQFGARTLILPSSGTSDQAEKLFYSINGFLIPGGDGAPAPFAREMLKLALHANRHGDYFPVWGTCLGFEWIIEIVGGNAALDHGFDSTNLPEKLVFTSEAPGRLFARANASLMQWFSQESITYNNHVDGITPTDEASNSKLSSMFAVLASGKDRKNRRFVSVIEARDFPIYATQFHPEKIQFVSGGEIPKTPHAIAGARYLADFFVRETYKSNHTSAQNMSSGAAECSEGSPNLCTCAELERHGYIQEELCKERMPILAIEHCQRTGGCFRAASILI